MAFICTLRICSLALLISSTTALAQLPQPRPFSKSLTPRITGIAEAAQPRTYQEASAVHKGSGIPSRLIAYGNTWPGVGSRDTATLVYSNGRGGDLTEANPLYYDSLFNKVWETSPARFVEYLHVQSFNPQHLPASRTEYYFNGSLWIPIIQEAWLYNSAGQDSVYTQSNKASGGTGWSKFRHGTYTYDTAGQLIEILIDAIDPATGSLQGRSRSIYTYNPAGSVTSHQRYIRDAAAGIWILQGTDDYAYTGSNLLSRYTVLNGPGQDSLMTTWYYYNAAGYNVANRSHHHPFNEDDSVDIPSLSPLGKPAVMTIYRLLDSVWEPQDRYVTTYTATEQVATEMRESVIGGTFNHNDRYSCAYNNYDQVNLVKCESYRNGVWGHWRFTDVTYRYHYGLIGAGIRQQEAMSISLSPVPANELLRFSLGDSGQASFSATILSADGRVLRTWYGLTGRAADLQMDTRLLPAGNYVLYVACNGRRGSQAFSILH